MSHPDYVARLQWGRVRVNAEGLQIRSIKLLAVSLQWGRVRVNAEGHKSISVPIVSGSASMGPRSCERGRLRILSNDFKYRALQWGRVRVNAEG